MLGVGTAGGIAAGVLGGLTLAKRGRYLDEGGRDAALYDDAVRFRTATNVAAFATGGLAAAGGVMLLVGYLGENDDPEDGSQAAESEASLQLGLGAAMLTLPF